jgi:tetratricopeptide (TPR) repeat protein
MATEWLQLAAKVAPIASRLASRGIRRALLSSRVAYSTRKTSKKHGIGTLRFWALRRYLSTGSALDALRSALPERYAGLGDQLTNLYKSPPQTDKAAALTVENLIDAYSRALNINETVALQGAVTANRVDTQIEARESRRFVGTTSFETNLELIPPIRAEEARSLRATWPAIEHFVQEFVTSSDRRAALRSWHRDPPSWFQSRTSSAIAWFAHLSNDYGEREVASAAFVEAISAGAAPVAYWRTREILASGVDLDEQAMLLEPFAGEDPIAHAIVAANEDDFSTAAGSLADWEPEQLRDRATKAIFLSQMLACDDLNSAIEVSGAGFNDLKSGTCGTLQAHFLARKGGARESSINFADLEGALEVAINARDAIRVWQGPSSAAVEIAVTAARLLGRFEMAWRLTQPAPEGSASAAEAADPAVRQAAALLAAAAGRREEANELLPPGAEPRIEHEVRALLAIVDQDQESEVAQWKAALEHATEPQDIARICLHIALLGEKPSKLDVLASTDAVFAQDVRLIAEAYGGSDEAKSILRARSLSTRTLAHSFIGLLSQHGGTRESAEVAERAGEQWGDAEFIAVAAEQHFELSDFDAAVRSAENALRIAGPTWEGAPRVSGTLINALLSQGKWEPAARAATEVLSRDPYNVSAVWVLTLCNYQVGQFEESWRSYTEIGDRPDPRDESEALVRIDLWRRFEGTYSSLETMTSLLDAFPQSRAVRQAVTTALLFTSTDEEDAGAIGHVRDLIAPLLAEQSDVIVQKEIDPENPIASLTQILNEFSQDPDHDSRIDEGRLPIGMGATIHRRSLTEVLSKMTSSPIFSGNHETFESEVEAALALQGKKTVVDLTALYALSLLESSFADQLLGNFLLPEVTRAQLIDSIQGSDALSHLSTLSIRRGPDGSAQPITISDAEAAEHYARAQRIRAQFDRLSLHPGVEIEHFEEIRANSRSFSWLAALDRAIDVGCGFWCDDRITRAIAIQRGVTTFGTQALIEALRRRGDLSNEAAVARQATLIRAYFVGLDFKADWVDFAGVLDRWQPRGVASFISNCAPGSDASAPPNFVIYAIRQVTDDPLAVQGWVAAVSRLLIRMAGSAHDAHSNLVTLLANLLQESWLESSRLPFVIGGVRDGIATAEVGDPLVQAMAKHYRDLVQRAGWEPAAQQVWSLIRLAEPKDRAIVTGVVLGVSGLG